jgi:hypothetical protein
MAITSGYVQRLTILASGLTCAFIGPAPTNTTALIVQPASGDTAAVLAWKSSRQQVQATHGDTDSLITGLTVGPGS